MCVCVSLAIVCVRTFYNLLYRVIPQNKALDLQISCSGRLWIRESRDIHIPFGVCALRGCRVATYSFWSWHSNPMLCCTKICENITFRARLPSVSFCVAVCRCVFVCFVGIPGILNCHFITHTHTQHTPSLIRPE